MRIIFFVVFLLTFSFSVHAETYEGVNGAFKMATHFVTDIWTFLETDVPDFITRFFAWFIEWIILAKLTVEYETIKFSWAVSKQVIENFQIGSKIAAASSALPRDVQAALVDMRAFDALNVVIQAYVSRFVMRFL